MVFDEPKKAESCENLFLIFTTLSPLLYRII